MSLASQRRFPENIRRLSRLVSLRDEAARMLGYEHHAALRMVDTMMGSVEKLRGTLQTLHSKLWPLAENGDRRPVGSEEYAWKHDQQRGRDVQLGSAIFCKHPEQA